jgi:nucleoside-diphosphate-sugar epimerase
LYEDDSLDKEMDMGFQSKRNKKILVTGGVGFLGRYFVRMLIQAGYHPILIVRPCGDLSPLDRVKQYFQQHEWDHLTVWEGDLNTLTKESIPSHWLVEQGDVQAMFHIAGLVKFDQSLKDMLLRVNVQGTENAIQIAKTLAIPRFFYVSTAYTAGRKEIASESLHSVDNGFHNPYEQSKCIAEHLVLKHHASCFETNILRPSIIIGDSNTGEADTQFSIYGFLKGLSLFKRKVEKRLHHEDGHLIFPLKIEADPDGLSNLVPVNYVADMMLTALETECEHRIYHLTNPAAPTKQQLLEVFAELLQVKGMALVPKLDRDVSKWDKRFAQFVSVYRPYLRNDPHFLTDHTQQLLRRAQKKVLHLQKEDYLRIFKPVLWNSEPAHE